MKTFKLVILACTMVMFGLAAAAQETFGSQDQEIIKNSDVEMYYFHFSRRCATCQAVEDVSKGSVKELYGDKVEFYTINLEEKEGEMKGDEIGVSGQALLIVSGDKKIDITSEGFMNARSNPDKLKEIIKENIDPLL
jgi:hypothetical protein